MLIATSIVYVLLSGTHTILNVALHVSKNSTVIPPYMYKIFDYIPLVYALSHLVFAYNFYVYFITGKQFRLELHKLFCSNSGCSSTTTTANVNVRITRHGQADTAV